MSDIRQGSMPLLLIVVVGLHLILVISAVMKGSNALLTSLAPLYVVLMIAVGHLTGRLYSTWFLSILCAGWAILMGIRYVVEPSTPEALIGAFVALLAVYYGYRHYRTGGPGNGDATVTTTKR